MISFRLFENVKQELLNLYEERAAAMADADTGTASALEKVGNERNGLIAPFYYSCST